VRAHLLRRLGRPSRQLSAHYLPEARPMLIQAGEAPNSIFVCYFFVIFIFISFWYCLFGSDNTIQGRFREVIYDTTHEFWDGKRDNSPAMLQLRMRARAALSQFGKAAKGILSLTTQQFLIFCFRCESLVRTGPRKRGCEENYCVCWFEETSEAIPSPSLCSNP